MTRKMVEYECKGEVNQKENLKESNEFLKDS